MIAVVCASVDTTQPPASLRGRVRAAYQNRDRSPHTVNAAKSVFIDEGQTPLGQCPGVTLQPQQAARCAGSEVFAVPTGARLYGVLSISIDGGPATNIGSPDEVVP